MWAAEAKLRKDIYFKKEEMIKKGTIVTITHGLNCKYAYGAEYIDETSLNIICNQGSRVVIKTETELETQFGTFSDKR